MESKRRIGLLTNDNYHTWSYEVKMLLMSKGLWIHCTLSFAEWLISSGGVKLEDGVELDLDTVPPAKKLEWEVNDPQCQALIGMHVPPHLSGNISSCKTARESWQALKKVFYETSNATKLLLKCQFFEARMKEGENLMTYLIVC